MKDRAKRDIKPPATLVIGITIAVIIGIIIGLAIGAISLEVSALLIVAIGLFAVLIRVFIPADDAESV